MTTEFTHTLDKELSSKIARLERELGEERAARCEAEAKVAKIAGVLESVSDAIIALNTDWCFIYLNENAAQVINRRRADMIGKNIWEEIPEAVGGAFYHAYHRSVAEQQPIQMEEYFPPWERWFEVRAYPSRDGITILFHDITERKRTEAEVAEKENRMRTVLAAAPQCIKVIARDGTLQEMNPAGLAIVEAESAEQVIGKDIIAVVNPPYRAEINELIARVFRGEEGRAEYEITGLKGTRRWLEIDAVPLRNQHNEVLAFLGITNEITDRKRAEEALRLLLEVTAAASETVNPGDMISRCLARICQLKCWQVGQAWLLDRDLLVASPHSFYADLDAHEFRAVSLETRFAKGTGLPGQVWQSNTAIFVSDITTSDNFPRRIQAGNAGLKAAFAFPIKLGEELFAVFEFFTPELREPDRHFLDAVEKLGRHLGIVFRRMLAEEALRESEERYRTLFEIGPDPILVFNLDRIITMVNQTAVAMYGVKDRAELVGRNVYEFLVPADQARALANASELLATGSARNIEYTGLKKDGSHFFVEWSASLVVDAAGRPTAVIGVSKDITRRKCAEEELKISHEQLRALSAHLQSMREEERTRIAREIHDELGQALTALKMDLSWLLKRLPEIGDNELATRLREKIRSMQALIDTTIQSVRRIATELRPVVLDQLGLAAAIEWQAEEFQRRSEISCTARLYSETIPLDQERSTTVFRIFQEILTNVARHAEATEVAIDVCEENDSLILTVSDNGKGIADSALANPQSLGLLGMRERALLLGGEFSISAAGEAGTRVNVRVPLSSAEKECAV